MKTARGFTFFRRKKANAVLKLNNTGFTLVELLVTISILAVLSVVGLTIYSTVQSKARDAKRIGDIDNISKAFETHFNEAGDALYPVPDADWFDGGIPLDPKNDTTYFYSWKGKDSAGADTGGAGVTFTICALLENNSGNSAGDGDGITFSTDRTAGSYSTYYCKKNLQ